MTEVSSVFWDGGGLGTANLGLFFAGIAAVLGVILWTIAATIITFRESSVDKPNRVPHLYGYTVCLIALLIGLMSIASLLDAVFERANPLQGDQSFSVSLTSFEAYKAKRTAFPSFGRDAASLPDTASDATLRTRYDALVVDRVATVRYQTTKSFVTKGILLLIAIVLFRFHWTWVRKLNGVHPAAG